MKHKHAELIKAWADGAEIEKRQIYCKYQMNEEPIIVNEEWLPCHSPTWAWNEEYRIKPESKPDIVKYLRATAIDEGVCRWDIALPIYANLKIVFDSETGQPKSTEVLK